MVWADGSCSDLIAYLHLFRVWEKNKALNNFKGANGENQWCRQHFLSSRALREWSFLVKEIKERLARFGIKQECGPSTVVLHDDDLYTVLRVVICGAFYPNYFRRAEDAGQVDEREAVKLLGGRDPYRTVYFKNMDLNQPGPLYNKRIKDFFRTNNDDMVVSFDSTTKIYVEFLRDIKETPSTDNVKYTGKIPGNVLAQVYRAVRMRQLKYPCILNVLPRQEGWREAKRLGIEQKLIGQTLTFIRRRDYEDDKTFKIQTSTYLPGLTDEYIKIIITRCIDAGHFWAQHCNEELNAMFFKMEQILNSVHLEPAGVEVKVGDILAAVYTKTETFHRCRVESIIPFGKNRTLMAQVRRIFAWNVFFYSIFN